MEISAEIFNRELFIEMLPSPKQNDNEMTDTLVGFHSSGIEEVDNRHLEHAHEKRKRREREKERERERAGARKYVGIS